MMKPNIPDSKIPLIRFYKQWLEMPILYYIWLTQRISLKYTPLNYICNNYKSINKTHIVYDSQKCVS